MALLIVDSSQLSSIEARRGCHEVGRSSARRCPLGISMSWPSMALLPLAYPVCSIRQLCETCDTAAMLMVAGGGAPGHPNPTPDWLAPGSFAREDSKKSTADPCPCI